MYENPKILFVYPEIPSTFWGLKNALSFVSKKALLPPLGLLTIASILPDSFEKKLTDMNVTPLRDKDLKWADYVFISAMFIQKKSVENVIERCKEMNVKIVAGGPLFTTLPEAYVNRIDHLVLPSFLEDLQNGCPKPYYTTREKPDLQDTPVPQWDLIDTKKYGLMGLQFSRGCPFDCDFCDVTNLLGHKMRTKKTEQIIAELESLYLHKWRGDVFFVDDNFIGKRKQLKNELLPAIIDWMEKRNHPFALNTQVSIDIVDDEQLMTMMTRAGFDCVFIGIESPDEKNLAECNKKQNTGRDIVAAVKKIQQFGMQVQAGFIVGFDDDKPTIFDKMITLIQDSGVVVAMVGLLNAPRGTKLYKRLRDENRLSKTPTGDNMDCTMNFIPKMDMKQLVNGYQDVLNSIYSQKNYCKRVKTFLTNYNFPNPTRIKITYSGIRALLKSMWRIGILEKDKIHFWKLMLWSLKKPYRFPLAVRFSIYGYHFRKIIEKNKSQLKELTAVLNDYNSNDYGQFNKTTASQPTAGKFTYLL